MLRGITGAREIDDRSWTERHITMRDEEKARGKGIGTALINAIKDYCKKKRIKVIKLTSGLELTRAHKFYMKNGGVFTEKLFRFNL